MGWNLFGGLMPPTANHTEEKERRHSGDSGIEGEEESEISGDRSQPEDKLQCSSFENGYEIIEVSDLDKIQIAGFSKQELLEVCNFCKISYGNNDEKLDSRYKTKAELINKGYGIIPFYYKKNGTPVGFVFTKDKEITIAYRGTKGLDDDDDEDEILTMDKILLLEYAEFGIEEIDQLTDDGGYYFVCWRNAYNYFVEPV